MADDALDDMLAYYQRELSYLHDRGADFARRYPKIAHRLELSGTDSRDPHVDRLIESFAFLTARLQRNIDSEFPEIPAALLSVLYPHLMAPIPSMAIAHFAVDEGQARAAQGFTLPRATPIFAESLGSARERLTCRFRTGYPVTLWPIEVTGADLVPADAFDFALNVKGCVSVLRLRLTCLGQWSFAEVTPPGLRFFINADGATAGAVYELLFGDLLGVAVLPEGASMPVARLAAETVLPVGFALDEGLLPYPDNAHLGYRLIQEYFTFPEKFHFFEATGLPPLKPHKSVDLLFLLGGHPRRRLSLSGKNFVLGAAPIVNLFPKTTEPIRVEQTASEYLLIPDNRWERSTEIHSILKVSATTDQADDSRSFRPFFSYDHHAAMTEARAFWMARRRPSVSRSVAARRG